MKFKLFGSSKLKIPEHVAIIMDGNGRWAKNKGLPRLKGHNEGAKSVREAISAAVEIGVKYLTLYTFSMDNWKRPSEETKGLFNLIEDNLSKEIGKLNSEQVKVRAIGDLEKIPQSTRDAFVDAQNLTKENKKLTLIVALNYSGRNEIINAVKKLYKTVESGSLSIDDISEDAITDNLYASDVPFPDLLIRSGGEMRVSDFLLWQIAYTEIWVTDDLWPDFKKKHFYQAVADYSKRKRKYGGLDE